MESRNDRETLCLRPRTSGNISFASIMKCLRLPRNSWISRLRYVLLPLPLLDRVARGGIVQELVFLWHSCVSPSSFQHGRLISYQLRNELIWIKTTNQFYPALQVENEERAQLPSRPGASPEQATALEESIFKLSAQLSTISRNQKYFRTRENRNFSTVRSTERRIFNFSVIEGLMMVSMAGLQVFVVRFFFQGARKGTYSYPMAHDVSAAGIYLQRKTTRERES